MPVVQLRPDAEALALLDAAARRMRASIASALPDGLGHAEFQVLQRLAEGEASAPGELARALRLTKGALTAILQRLGGQGLVAIVSDASDQRRKRVSLTEAGARAHAAALKRLRPNMEQLRAAVPEAEFREALPFLRRLEAALAELRSPA